MQTKRPQGAVRTSLLAPGGPGTVARCLSQNNCLGILAYKNPTWRSKREKTVHQTIRHGPFNKTKPSQPFATQPTTFQPIHPTAFATSFKVWFRRSTSVGSGLGKSIPPESDWMPCGGQASKKHQPKKQHDSMILILWKMLPFLISWKWKFAYPAWESSMVNFSKVVLNLARESTFGQLLSFFMKRKDLFLFQKWAYDKTECHQVSHPCKLLLLHSCNFTLALLPISSGVKMGRL